MNTQLTVATFSEALSAILPNAVTTSVLCVSGGIDSMVLWHLFRGSGRPYVILHVNFRLRGADSEADADLVRRTAAERGVEAHVYDAPADLATASGRGVQERARALRLKYSSALSDTLGGAPVLLAHHADDQAETVLMRLTRGTGGAGLIGMTPASPPLYRPLLDFTRAQIEAYAKTHNVGYREDRSNASGQYTRNAFRHHVLPAVLASEPRAVQGILRTARQQADLVQFARAAALRTLAAAVLAEADPSAPEYDRQALATVPGRTTLCYFWLHELGYRSAQITELSAWIADGAPQRRRMVHPNGREVIIVTGRRVYRAPLPHHP